MRIGIDLGGTKIEGLALADDGRELDRRRDRRAARQLRRYGPGGRRSRVGDRIGLPRRSGQAGQPRRWASAFPARSRRRPASSRTRTRPGSTAGRWPSDLSQALGRPVRLANDANCFALSEATDGAAAGAAVVFGVIIGTGTGGGLVVNGRIVVGANAIAGEWGHNPMPAPDDDERPGPPCYCGRSGCIETFLSGPGAGARLHRARRRRHVRGGHRGAGASSGDARASACLDRYERRFARAIASIINVVDPRRDRARRRIVQHDAALRSRADALGAARLFRSCRHAAGARQTRRRQRRARRRVAVACLRHVEAGIDEARLRSLLPLAFAINLVLVAGFGAMTHTAGRRSRRRRSAAVDLAGRLQADRRALGPAGSSPTFVARSSVLDFLFPIAYAFLISLPVSILCESGGVSRRRLVVLAPWVAGAADYVENILLLSMLGGPQPQPAAMVRRHVRARRS